MEDYQKRMLEEYRELNERIKKMNKFIGTNPTYKDLPTYKKYLMNKQMYAMIFYGETLFLRLKADGLDVNEIAKETEFNDLNEQS